MTGAQLFDIGRIGAEVRGQAQAGVARGAAYGIGVDQVRRRVKAGTARLALPVTDDGRGWRRGFGHGVSRRASDALQRRWPSRGGDAALEAQDLAARRLAIAHVGRRLLAQGR